MKTAILIFALVAITTLSLGQSKTKTYNIKHVNVLNEGTKDTSAVKKHSVKAKKVTQVIASPDSVKVASADLKNLMRSLSQLINNSSDITTKQANAKDGPNEQLNKMYNKFFPR